MPRTNLPLIDVSRIDSANAEQRKSLAKELRLACEDRGFFYICNHEVSPALIRRVFVESQRFFSLPLEAKLAVDKSRSYCNRGYEPLKAQTLQAGQPPDLKEGMYIGVELPESDPRVQARKFNHGPNQWPADMPGFRETMDEYFGAMLSLGRRLMRALALSLDLDERYFNEFLTGATSTLRPLHYPPQPSNTFPGEKGCGEHTDFGSLTLLLQDDTGGLQVWDAQQKNWIDAPPVPGTFVVNTGDLISRWTNRQYHSTLHRVVNVSGKERYSVPFFLAGAPDYVVSCLPTCAREDEMPIYPPVTVTEHLEECYRRTYG